jgi:MFS family permease
MSSVAPVQSRTPLPKLQLALLLFIQLTEPITAEVIYPFIAGVVKNTGIIYGDETKTGYFAGLLVRSSYCFTSSMHIFTLFQESVFFLAECLTVFYWGRLSDNHGRRRILLFGPLGLTLAMLGFGLSKSFAVLVFFRACQGTFNGNIGTRR